MSGGGIRITAMRVNPSRPVDGEDGLLAEFDCEMFDFLILSGCRLMVHHGGMQVHPPAGPPGWARVRYGPLRKALRNAAGRAYFAKCGRLAQRATRAAGAPSGVSARTTALVSGAGGSLQRVTPQLKRSFLETLNSANRTEAHEGADQ